MDKNLIQRSITGALFVIVLVGAMWWSAWSMAALFLLITILGVWEFYRLSEKAGAEPQKMYGTILSALIVITAFLVKASISFYCAVALIPLFFVPFFIELYRQKKNPFANIGWTLLGVFYIAIPFALLVLNFTPFMMMRRYVSGGDLPSSFIADYHPGGLITFFVLIWTSDTMAYVCGRLFGKHKLFERVSPKKTWEGFIGGMIFTVVAGGMIANWILYNRFNYSQEIKWIITAVIISITGVLGDLSESLFKRSIDVKDSGTILPGHGGILDRFDAMLLATPFALIAQFICDILQQHPLSFFF